MGIGALVLVTGIPRLDLSDNWTTYFDERYQFRRDTDFVTRNLSGMETLEYSLTSGREGGVTDPDYLRRVDAFAEWYRGQPEVTHVHAFSDTMKRLERNMHGDDPAFHRLPDDPELAAQYLLLYELSLPFGADLDNRIDVARSATRMIVVMRSLTSREQRALDARAQAWLRRNAPGLAGEASGMTTLFAHLSERNIEAMLRAPPPSADGHRREAALIIARSCSATPSTRTTAHCCCGAGFRTRVTLTAPCLARP